jgi:hypothetical protein
VRAKRAPLFKRAERAIKLTKQTVLTFVRSEASTTYDGDFRAERWKSSRQLSEADKANRRDGGWVCPRSVLQYKKTCFLRVAGITVFVLGFSRRERAAKLCEPPRRGSAKRMRSSAKMCARTSLHVYPI